ncbi:hypothetical protein SASPL_142967 [Salvia splendens]|uniref:Isopenicillin N synthase-like Fe(2+) 2OG dioxygenase domain-containing protein n=1 Tax=Salvia splendens TaxID=180675 RepID=A0A8X8WK16_SALSN|nr:hypothetical protein SASPL_142967 [Salvia splendens]
MKLEGFNSSKTPNGLLAVKPNKDALIVNIGDLFQAWSNNLYKSVEHKVMANPNVERFSVAYFLCPSYESMIKSCKQPSLYTNFTFAEYRVKVQEDARLFGRKSAYLGFYHHNYSYINIYKSNKCIIV